MSCKRELFRNGSVPLKLHLVYCVSQCQMGESLHLNCVSSSSGAFSRSDTVLHFTSISPAWLRNPAWIQDGTRVTTADFRYVCLSVKCSMQWGSSISLVHPICPVSLQGHLCWLYFIHLLTSSITWLQLHLL